MGECWDVGELRLQYQRRGKIRCVWVFGWLLIGVMASIGIICNAMQSCLIFVYVLIFI